MSSLISLNEAAQRIKSSTQFVRNQIKNGSLEAKKIGHSWVIELQSLQTWVDDNHFIVEPDDHPRESSEIPSRIAFSFFTGAGGLDIGLAQTGIHPVLVSDIDKHARKSISQNYPEAALIGDINSYDADKIYAYAKIPRNRQVDYVFGGPPCQAFSTAGKRRGYEDARGDVFIKYLDLIGDIKPRYAIIENVRGLLSIPAIFDSSETSIKGGVLLYALEKLKSFGYTVSFNLYNSANFNAAETRERVIIIAKLGSEKVDYLEPTNSEHSTLGLPSWRSFGEVVGDIKENDQHFIKYPEKRLKFIQDIPEGGNWRSLPDDLQKQAMGKSYALSGGKTGFYRRLSFNKPAPTLVTHPTMPATDLIHPIEDRPLSVEEYARIQGFPDDWVIEGSLLDKYKQIGNAVPIALGEAIGSRIKADEAGIKINPKFRDFKYSRYHHTDDLSWLTETLKNAKLTKSDARKLVLASEKQLSLF